MESSHNRKSESLRQTLLWVLSRPMIRGKSKCKQRTNAGFDQSVFLIGIFSSSLLGFKNKDKWRVVWFNGFKSFCCWNVALENIVIEIHFWIGLKVSLNLTVISFTSWFGFSIVWRRQTRIRAELNVLIWNKKNAISYYQAFVI